MPSKDGLRLSTTTPRDGLFYFVRDVDYKAWARDIEEGVDLCFLAIVHVPQAVVTMAVWEALLGPGSQVVASRWGMEGGGSVR